MSQEIEFPSIPSLNQEANITKSIYKSNVNRREFLKHSGSLAAGAAVFGSISPIAFARDDNTIRLALIGCGGRGAGAVGDALNVPDAGPVYPFIPVSEGDIKLVQRLISVCSRTPSFG